MKNLDEKIEHKRHQNTYTQQQSCHQNNAESSRFLHASSIEKSHDARLFAWIRSKSEKYSCR
jgi:hypothetical protein